MLELHSALLVAASWDRRKCHRWGKQTGGFAHLVSFSANRTTKGNVGGLFALLRELSQGLAVLRR